MTGQVLSVMRIVGPRDPCDFRRPQITARAPATRFQPPREGQTDERTRLSPSASEKPTRSDMHGRQFGGDARAGAWHAFNRHRTAQ